MYYKGKYAFSFCIKLWCKVAELDMIDSYLKFWSFDTSNTPSSLCDKNRIKNKGIRKRKEKTGNLIR